MKRLLFLGMLTVGLLTRGYAQDQNHINLSAGPNFTIPISNKEQVNYGFQELSGSRGFQVQAYFQWFTGRRRNAAFNVGLGFMQNRLGWRDPSINFRDTLHPMIDPIPDLVGPPRTADYFYNFHYITVPFSYKRYVDINTSVDLLFFAWSVGLQADIYLYSQTLIRLEGYTVDEQDKFRFKEKIFSTSPVNITPFLGAHVEYGITTRLFATGKLQLAANALSYDYRSYSARLFTPGVQAGISWQLKP